VTTLNPPIAAPRSQRLHLVESPDAPTHGRTMESIHRRFFTAAIACALTAGATWGAWLLWQIGFSGAFTGASVHHVNAHGHAQIFGWVGLFIMGFGYRLFPRFWGTKLAAPKLAGAAFGLMIVGLVVRTVGMTTADSVGAAVTAAMIGAGLEILAVATFAVQIAVTFARSDARLEPYVGFILAAVFWFVAMSAASAWHTFTTMSAESPQELLWYVSTYQAPLRDLQIHGLSLFMILGVSMRVLPGLMRLPRVPHRRAWTALGVLTAAVIGESVLFVAYRWTAAPALAGALMVPWVLLAIGVAMVALPWRLWRRSPATDRSSKFVRAAYAWLAVSLIMMLLLPAYQAISDAPFSHAYYGGIRHAVTVGFISMMILGVSSTVAPSLQGIDPRKLTPLWIPFVLLNVGCALRVSLQVLTDWHPGFFRFVGVSGLLEVTALAIWGTHLVRVMWRRPAAAKACTCC
jgi:hypothetical protein